MPTATAVKQKVVTRTHEEPPGIDRDIRARMLVNMSVIEETWVTVSVDIVEIYERELWKGWNSNLTSKPFDSFRQYVEEELGLTGDSGYRLAMFRLQMGQAIITYGIKADQIRTLGWSKFKEVCQLFTEGMSKSTVDKLIDTASKKKNYKEVEEWVKKEKLRRHGKDYVTKKKMQFSFTDDQAEVVERAIAEAIKIAGPDTSPSFALELICTEYLNTLDPEQFKQLIERHVPPKTKVEKAPPKKRASATKKKADNGKSVGGK